MSDTPRTDAFCHKLGRLASFTAGLERELNEATADAKHENIQRRKAIALLARAEAERDELLEALRKIADNPGACDTETGFVSGHIARNAMSKVKGGNHV